MADLYYIESNYFTPEYGYYVYTADAEATISASASVTCVIGKLQSAEASVSANFTPTLTVDVLKNHTALLDAVVTMSTVAVVNRSITQTLDSIANVNAMADRTRETSATLNSESSLSAIVGKIQTAESAQSITASLTAIGLNLQFASATLSLITNLSTTVMLRGERPLEFESSSGSIAITNTQSKFGGKSLRLNGGYATLYARDELMLPTPTNGSLSIEFWCYTGAQTTGSPIISYYTPNLLDTGGNRKWFVDIDSLERIGFVSSNISITSNQLSTNSWHHIKIESSISGGSYRTSIYVDGSRSGASTSSTSSTYTSSGGNNGYLRFGYPSGLDLYIDDLRIQVSSSVNPSSTTTSVPTDESINTIYTGYLGHFNIDYRDDVSVTEVGSADFNVTASISIITSITKTSSATLSSSASLTASIGVLKETSATGSSESTLSADITRTREVIAGLESSATMSALVGVIKEFASTELSAFETGVVCQAQLAGVALLESSTTLSATAVKTVDGVQALSTAFSLSAIPTTTSGASAGLSSAFTQTASVDRIRYVDSSLAASTTLSVDIVKYREFTATVSSEFTQSTAIDHLVGFTGSISSEFTQTVSADRTRNAIAGLSSTVTLSATILRIRYALADLSSSATVSATAVVTADTPINLAITATSSITAVKTVNAIPVLDSIATQLTVAVKNATGTITLESAASLTVLTGKIIEYPRSVVSGVEVYAYDKYPKILNNFSSFSFAYPSDVGFTLSIWARRNSNTGNFQPLASDDPSNVFAFTLYGDDFLLRQNFDPDEPNGYWINNIPTDTDWHHFLFHNTILTSGGVRKYRLWVDGEFKGLTETQVYPSGRFTYNDYTELGRATLAQLTGPYTTANYYLDGSLAQIWIGNITNIDPTLFYDGGYVDLGANGRGAGNLLPTPLIYSELNQPYTDVTFVGGYTTEEKSASQPIYYNSIVARASLSATPQVALVAAANLSAIAGLTAGATKSVVAAADLNSQASLSATPNAYTGIIANLTSQATVSATVYRIQPATATLASTAGLTVVTGFERQFASLEMAAATLICDATVIFPIRTSADLSSAFTITADITTFSGIASTMEVTATLIADVTVKPPIRIDATLVSTATLTVTVGAIEQFAVLAASSGTMSVIATRIQRISAGLSAVTSLSAINGRTVGITAVLNCQGFVLTTGTIINIDPYLTLVVAPESRYYYVLPENRVRIIESETRVNIV